MVGEASFVWRRVQDLFCWQKTDVEVCSGSCGDFAEAGASFLRLAQHLRSQCDRLVEGDKQLFQSLSWDFRVCDHGGCQAIAVERSRFSPVVGILGFATKLTLNLCPLRFGCFSPVVGILGFATPVLSRSIFSVFSSFSPVVGILGFATRNLAVRQQKIQSFSPVVGILGFATRGLQATQ